MKKNHGLQEKKKKQILNRQTGGCKERKILRPHYLGLEKKREGFRITKKMLREGKGTNTDEFKTRGIRGRGNSRVVPEGRNALC